MADQEPPSTVLNLIRTDTSNDAEIMEKASGDIDGNRVTDWVIAVTYTPKVGSDSSDNEERIKLFVIVGRKDGSYKAIYKSGYIPILMRGSHVSGLEINRGIITINSYGHTCCVFEGNSNYFEYRNGSLVRTKTIIDVSNIEDDDGSVLGPDQHIEIDYVKRIKMTRTTSKSDKALNKTTTEIIKKSRLLNIKEVM